jgi:uncharacterized RDD family membrane protein YckC
MNGSQSDEVVRGEDIEDCPEDLKGCHSEPPPTALPQSVVRAACVDAATVAQTDSQDPARTNFPETELSQSELTKSDSPQEFPPEESQDSAWRDELTARLSRYRARRKMRPPRYPSLLLQFDAHRSVDRPGSESPEYQVRPVEAVFEAGSNRIGLNQVSSSQAGLNQAGLNHAGLNQALALDLSTPGPGVEIEAALPVPSAEPGLRNEHSSTARPQARSGAKIIEFPKTEFPKIEFPKYGWEASFEPCAPPADQLAEPVTDRPRILEVPDYELPPPALGGITIEPVQRQDAEKRLGIDIPVQTASLARRIFASLIDGAIVGAGVALFGSIFWKITGERPPLGQLLGMVAGSVFVFWAAYQYLLLVYAAGTPGLLAAGLEIARFNGSATSRSLRRWRVLASYLSAVSLGMGYAWVFLDEDVLCWHDRITHTYLAPKKRTVRDAFSISS